MIGLSPPNGVRAHTSSIAIEKCRRRVPAKQFVEVELVLDRKIEEPWIVSDRSIQSVSEQSINPLNLLVRQKKDLRNVLSHC